MWVADAVLNLHYRFNEVAGGRAIFHHRKKINLGRSAKLVRGCCSPGRLLHCIGCTSSRLVLLIPRY